MVKVMTETFVHELIRTYMFVLILCFVADKFCFNCIKQWIKVVSSKASKQRSSVTCPLCKVCFLETLFSAHNTLKNLFTGMTITYADREFIHHPQLRWMFF